tara:strand:+ start:11524 stop:12699 length:1176 start_codon:yes stop_codon:yes gene_type:complete
MNLFKSIILLSYISVASASAAIITPALPAIASSYHLDKGSLEWVITLFLLGYMIGQLVYGPIANRFGRLFALRAGFAINIIGILCCMLSNHFHSYEGLLIGRTITALGAAAGLCCTFTLIHELMSEHQAKQALSYAILSFTLGIGAAILVGGYITQYFAWQDMFWVLLVHAVLVLASTVLFHEPAFKQHSIHVVAIAKAYMQAFSHKKLVIFSCFVGISSVFSYCYTAAAPIITHQRFGLTAAQYGGWNVLTMVGMCCGSLSAAALIKRLPPMKLLWLSIILIIPCLLSLVAQYQLGSTSTLWFFLNATGLYFFTSWLYPCATLFASKAIDDKANASSSMNFINMAMAMIAVTVMGYLPFAAFASLMMVVSVYVVFCVLMYAICLTTKGQC